MAVEPGMDAVGAGIVQSQAAVAFELRFAEPLVSCRSIGKGRVFPAEVDQIGRKIAGVDRFDVEDLADSTVRVPDSSRDAAVRAGWRGSGRFKLRQIQRDFGSMVNAALADRHADSLKGKVAVLFCIADDDGGAMAANKLIETHVLEMPTISEVDEGRPIVHHAEELGQQVEEP